MSQNPNLGELLHGSFYDILRSVGIAPDQVQLENLRRKCDLLGKKMEAILKLQAIEVGEKLQDATQAGFEKFGEKFVELSEQVEALQAQLNKVSTQVGRNKKRIEYHDKRREPKPPVSSAP